MSADSAYRLALQQRLATGGLIHPAVAAGDNCLQWQQLLIHCGLLPLSSTPAANLALELNSPWLPPQAGSGFALLVAGQRQALQQARPLLDALAPQAGGWLYCGPLGAASFCRRVFDALFYLSGPLLLQQAASGQPLPIDWPGLLLQQQELLQQLAALSRDYLQQQGDSAAANGEPWQVLDDFRQPPQQQQHFARSLAHLLLLAHGLGENARQLLETALDLAAAAAPENAKSPP
ncbi:6-phosphogluconate dehydrogenase [Vogesella facilis]|uniref:6-phosphogluconate dehydrogenase n=1 Tax=Vogesella facilis TaxID=1655232 RepID=A0ABV7RIF7_9NEIS